MTRKREYYGVSRRPTQNEQTMNKYDYRINPVRQDGKCVTACSESDPRLIDFGLYRVIPDGRVKWVSDHPDYESAVAAVPAGKSLDPIRWIN